MSRLILGIDPGLSGALALLDPANFEVETFDMPTLRLARGGKGRREIDLSSLARLVDDRATSIEHAYIEMAGARPGQGTASMFAFGKGYGIVLGIVSANFIPLTTVAATKWKRRLSVPAAKDGARARAGELLPSAARQWTLVKDNGRAEAALIALYGARDLAGVGEGRA